MGIVALLQNRMAAAAKRFSREKCTIIRRLVCLPPPCVSLGHRPLPVARVVSECCVRASNFMKTNPSQNKRTEKNRTEEQTEREGECTASALHSHSKSNTIWGEEYIRAVADRRRWVGYRIDGRGSERSWEIKAFNYNEGRKEGELRY